MVILESAADDAADDEEVITNLSSDTFMAGDSDNNNRLFPVTATSDTLLESCTQPSSGIVYRPITGNHCQVGTESGRLVTRDGRSNIYWHGVNGRLRKYAIDAMTSIAQLPFYYHALAFMATLFISWTGFGLLWWLMAAVNGDLIGEDEYNTLARLLAHLI